MTHYASQPEDRSILFPLILIALGALWLLGNWGVISTANLWAVLRFWPVLLIALGVDAILRWRWPLLANSLAVAWVALAVGAVIFAPRLGLAAGPSWMSWAPFMIGGTRGSGQLITQTRDVSDFQSVSFSAFGDLTIQQGEQAGVTIEAEDNVLPEIRTQVRGGRLHIDYLHPNGWARVRPTRTIRYTVTVASLEGLDLSGAGSVRVVDMTTDRLQAALSGAGSLALENLQAGSAAFRLSGAGSLDAAGTAGDLDIVVSGVGSYNGGSLQSDTARVTLSGLGSATVWASQQLEASLSGLGSVDYYGQPRVSQSVSGLGRVHSLGNK